MADAANSGPLTAAPVFSSLNSRTYSGSEGDYKEVAHKAKFELSSGTISLGFKLDRLAGDYTHLLFGLKPYY